MAGKGVITPQKDRSDLIVRLQEAQQRYGYVPEEVIRALADSLNIPVHEVYGVASFYSFLSTRPLGRNVIRVCKSLPCYLKSAEMIMEAVQKELGIGLGETTPDGRFTFQLTNCIGLCDHAPAMLINQDTHVDLTPEKIKQILKSYQ
ncbi:MAG TPA: NADH-quinone oxidoreductase subunit NuoE [Dehalococcoidia bacterium]|nr:NADH-quinone oxidoreductase subunit NuoE [Dehalococcoidia bacterium]